VLDEETYLRGRLNPEEGGTKGIAIDPSGRLLLLTCEERPMWCVSLCSLGIDTAAGHAGARGRPTVGSESRLRDVVLRAHRRIDALSGELAATQSALGVSEQERGALRAERDALAALVGSAQDERRRAEYCETVVADREAQLADLRASTSWRVTAPLRWVSGVAGRLRRRRVG
jgi:hypothetical protein